MTLHRSLAAPLLAAVLALFATAPTHAGFSDRPGDFDYYALVLSWSPSFCLAQDGAHASDPQCSARRPYAFVVHGLWPQYDKGWPSNCGAGNEPRVPRQIVDDVIDAIPTEKLMNHEWQTHGTCSGLTVGNYFGLARALYKGISIPPKYANLTAPLEVTVPDLRSDLLRANPQLQSSMIAVDCESNGRLREIHFCYAKDGKPAACGRNEVQGKMCRTDLVTLPPVRGVGLNGGVAGVTSPSNNPSANDQSSNPDNQAHYKKHHKKHWYNGIFQRGPLIGRAQ